MRVVPVWMVVMVVAPVWMVVGRGLAALRLGSAATDAAVEAGALHPAVTDAADAAVEAGALHTATDSL